MVSSPSPKAVRRHERSQSLLSPLPSTSELPYRQLSPQSSRGSTAWTERFNSAGSRAGGKRRAGAESAVVVGKKKSYFVDVVVDGLETDEDGGYLRPDVVSNFFACLGTKIANPSGTTTTTPAKPARVDLRGARTYTKEVYATEVNYCRKITVLRDVFATPLRTQAAAHRGLLTSKQTEQLFSNLDQLVTLSQDFIADLEECCPELVDEDDETNIEHLPAKFGRVVLRNVRRMAPFKRWLSEAAERDTTYEEYRKRIPGFKDWIDQQQLFTAKDPQARVYFKSALTEPFQRLTRYGLLFEQIIRFSPESDANVAHLVEAKDKTREFCTSSQRLDTHQAATMWGLQESIEGLPSSFVDNSRTFIASLDVDELHDASRLQTTLLLFNDKLLIVKRPSDVGKGTGLHHAGLDKDGDLVKLYSLANSTNGGSQRSPKKLKHGALKYRGMVDLLEVIAVDLGGMEVGIIFDNPPLDSTERWNGRPMRRFTVATTYETPEARRAAKETFLPQLAASKCSYKARFGYIALKGNAITGTSEGDSTRVYWSVCRREEWDDQTASKRGPIVAHVDWSGEASDLSFGIHDDPKLIMKVDIEEDGVCSVRVRSKGDEADEAKSIELHGFVPAVVETCLKAELFTFPSAEDIALSPTQSQRTRPRSMLLSLGVDVFGSSPALSRGGSNASKMSAASSYLSSASSTSRDLRLSPGKLLKRATPAWLVSSTSSKASIERPKLDLDIQFEHDDSERDSRGRSDAASGRRKGPRHSSLPPNPAARMDISPVRPAFLDVVRSTNPGETTPTSTPRRRVHGPREPGSAPNTYHSPLPSPDATLVIGLVPSPSRTPDRSPGRTPQPKLTPIETNIFDDSFPKVESASKRVRSGDTSPLATPAKKLATAGLSIDRSPNRSAGNTGVTSRKKKRIISGASVLRVESPLQERKLTPSESRKSVSPLEFHIDPEATPLDRLYSHVAILKSTLAHDDISNKENGRGITRSPKKPNLQEVQEAMMGSPRSRSVQGSTTDLVRWSTHALSLIDDCRFAEEERVFSKRFEEESTALVQSETIARLEQEVAMLNQQLVESKSCIEDWVTHSDKLEQIITNNNADYDQFERNHNATLEELARSRAREHEMEGILRQHGLI